MASGARSVNSADLSTTLKSSRTGVFSLVAFSFCANLLMLTGPLFMLQIYDRVLPSGSIPTLLALALLVVILYAVFGVLEFIRSRLLVRAGRLVNDGLRERAFDAVATQAMRGAGHRNDPLYDLQTLRQFLQSVAPLAFLDMPWTPVYLGVIFLMHSVLGYASLAAAVLLAMIAALAEQITRKDAIESHRAALQANELSDQCRMNIEAATVLGMVGRLRRRWAATQDAALDSQTRASDRGGLLSSLSRTLRLVFQSAILGLGAYLAVRREISPGAMIAATILMSRALAPVELAIGQWPQFQAFIRSWKRLNATLCATAPRQTRMHLPAPTGRIIAENLSAFVPGIEKPVVANVSLVLEPGDGLGIIGPTGAGKSTLARALVGAWPLTRGTVRLDGATPDQWHPDILGRSIGYLSQESELFDGTIAENISRFAADPRAEAIVAAARQADIHELVLQMPDGYNTLIGHGRRRLSAGERQRIGLARALYGEPTLVVLDEPNANLDAGGEAALVRAIAEVRARGGTVIVVAHRPSAIASLDKLMVLKDGKVVAMGCKDEILSTVLARPVERSGRPGGLTVISDRRS